MDTKYLTTFPQTLTDAQKNMLCSNIGTARTTRVVGNIHFTKDQQNVYQGVTLDGITISVCYVYDVAEQASYGSLAKVWAHYGTLDTSLEEPTESIENVAISSITMPKYYSGYGQDDPEKGIGQAWPVTLYTTLGNNARTELCTLSRYQRSVYNVTPQPAPGFATGGYVHTTLVHGDNVYRIEVMSMFGMNQDTNEFLNKTHYVIIFERLT